MLTVFSSFGIYNICLRLQNKKMMEQPHLPQLAISVTPEQKDQIKNLALSHNLTLREFTMLAIERLVTELQLNPNLAQLGNTL